MRRTRLIPLCCSLTMGAVPLHAQWQATADAGASRLRQTGIAESVATTLAATVAMFGDRSSLQSNLLAAGASAGTWTVQGLIAGSLLGAASHPVRWELTGLLSTFGESHELPTASGEVMVRGRFGDATRGGAVGFGTGATAHDGGVQPLFHSQGNVWTSIDDDQFVAGVSVVRTQSGSSEPTLTLSPVSYADLSLNWTHESGGFSTGASAGARRGISGITGLSGWGSVDAVTWFTHRTALVVSAGSTLADIVRGVPATRFLSAALRIATQPHASVLTRRAAANGIHLVIERSEKNGVQRIDVRAAHASRIELMADFTGWRPVVLSRVGDVWRTERSIPPGLHQVAVRIDGGEWTAPANLRQITDELGGVVGLVMIP